MDIQLLPSHRAVHCKIVDPVVLLSSIFREGMVSQSRHRYDYHNQSVVAIFHNRELDAVILNGISSQLQDHS